jgi:hypothetical protein
VCKIGCICLKNQSEQLVPAEKLARTLCLQQNLGEASPWHQVFKRLFTVASLQRLLICASLLLVPHLE